MPLVPLRNSPEGEYHPTKDFGGYLAYASSMDQLAGLTARGQKDRAGSLPFAATPFGGEPSVAASSSRSGNPVPFRPVLVDDLFDLSSATRRPPRRRRPDINPSSGRSGL